MDLARFNWAWFALGVLAVLLAAWAVRARQANAGPVAGVVSLAHLLLAGLNSAAPVRGCVDPGYVGYSFGLLQADGGLAVTLLAGGVWLLAVLGGFLALARSRLAMAFVTLTSGAFAANLGYPVVYDLLTGAADERIQLGEYLAISGLAATATLVALLVAPFVLGVIWAAGRVLKAG